MPTARQYLLHWPKLHKVLPGAGQAARPGQDLEAAVQDGSLLADRQGQDGDRVHRRGRSFARMSGIVHYAEVDGSGVSDYRNGKAEGVRGLDGTVNGITGSHLGRHSVSV